MTDRILTTIDVIGGLYFLGAIFTAPVLIGFAVMGATFGWAQTFRFVGWMAVVVLVAMLIAGRVIA